MNRTASIATAFAALLTAPALAQAPGVAAPADPVSALVAAMQVADRALVAARVELVVHTHGVLHVLRGTQSAWHSTFSYRTDDGVQGQVESAQTTAGIHQYSDDPVFGELFVHLEPKLVLDLEWAGALLQRDDLPGTADARAQSPLGIGMLTELRHTFDFVVDSSRTERAAEAGTWLVGTPKAGLPVDDPTLPIADRVEAFVRTRDRVMVELVMKQQDIELERIEVVAFEQPKEMPPKAFVVDGRGQRLREAKEHPPLWEEIEQVCAKAEQKLRMANEKLPEAGRPKPEVRPSRR
jgi:hypothetical protein